MVAEDVGPDKGCALDTRIKEYGTRIIALAVYAATAQP
jgi:hypothetical protein